MLSYVLIIDKRKELSVKYKKSIDLFANIIYYINGCKKIVFEK